LTRGQLDALRARLPPFGEGPPPPEFAAYLRGYALEFAAQVAGVSHCAGAVASGPYRLATQLWTRPDARANLLLLHGYYDHTGLFGKLIAWGLARGCNVLIFDLPGHGLSTGEPAVIDDFSDYGRAIAAVLAQVSLPDLPLWVMAQSTGAAALVDCARRQRPWPFAAMVLLAPLVRPAGWRGVRLAHTLLGPFTTSVPRKFNANSSDPEFLEFVRRDPLQCREVPLRWIGALRRWLAALPHTDLGVGPALVIQGDSDHTVDWRYNLGVIQTLFPGSRVEHLAGAGHQLANESAAYRDRYLGVVADYLAARGIRIDAAAQS